MTTDGVQWLGSAVWIGKTLTMIDDIYGAPQRVDGEQFSLTETRCDMDMLRALLQALPAMQLLLRKAADGFVYVRARHINGEYYAAEDAKQMFLAKLGQLRAEVGYVGA